MLSSLVFTSRTGTPRLVHFFLFESLYFGEHDCRSKVRNLIGQGSDKIAMELERIVELAGLLIEEVRWTQETCDLRNICRTEFLRLVTVGESPAARDTDCAYDSF